MLRFSLTQLLLILTLCALLCALVAAVSDRMSRSCQPIAVTYSPDGSLLAVGFDDGQVSVWDLAEGRLLKRFRQISLPGSIYYRTFGLFQDSTLAFNAEGDRLFVTNLLWSRIDSFPIDDDQRPSRLRLPPVIVPRAGAFSADGRLLALSVWAGTRSAVQLWDTNQQSHVGDLLPQSSIAPAVNVAFAQDPRRVAAAFDDGTIEIWDPAEAVPVADDQDADNTASGDDKLADSKPKAKPSNTPDGKSLVQLQTTIQFPMMEFSPDAQRLAVIDRYGFDNEIQLYDVSNGRAAATLPVQNTSVRQMAFSHDGSLLVVAGHEGAVEVWDVPTGNLRAVLRSGKGNKSCVAFAPDGKTLAVCTYGQIALFDSATFIKRRTLWQQSYRFYIYLLVPALAVWAAFWGFTQRRSPTQRHARDGAAARPAPTKPSSQPEPSWRSALVIFLLLAALLAVFVQSFAVQKFVAAPVRGYLVALVLTIVLLPLLVLAAAYLFLLARTFLQYSHRWQLSRARRCAGGPGQIRQRGAAAIWVPVDQTVADSLPDELDKVSRRFAALVGASPDELLPLLTICFVDQQAYDRFNRFQIPVAGYYLPIKRRPQMIFCQEASTQRLFAPRQTLQILLGYYLIHSYKGFFPHPWLTTSFGHVLCDDTRGASDRLRRRLLATWQRGEPLSAKAFFDPRGRAVSRCLFRKDHASYTRWQHFADQANGLGRFLCGEGSTDDRRARFGRFLCALKKGDNYENRLRQHFGFGFDELLAQCQTWVREHPIGGHQPPPKEMCRVLQQSIVPVVRDTELPAVQRIDAVRRLAVAGFATGADGLIQCLSDNNPKVRSEAVWALEMISGQSLGEDPSAWQSWWSDLPRVVREPEPDEPADEDIVEAELVDARLRSVSAAGAAAGAQPVPVSPSPPRAASTTPGKLKTYWLLSAIGGVVAITWSAYLLFDGPRVLVFAPPVYYGLWLGCRAISRVTGGREDGLRRTAAMHICNLMACDVVNFTIGSGLLSLANSLRVRESSGD